MSLSDLDWSHVNQLIEQKLGEQRRKIREAAIDTHRDFYRLWLEENADAPQSETLRLLAGAFESFADRLE